MAPSPSRPSLGNRFRLLLSREGRDKRTREQLRAAKNALATAIRTQIGVGLARHFLERESPYRDDPRLRAMLEDGVLERAALIRKPPHLLHFYRRLILGLERTPRSILEIGVKGGGSTALWKTLFPTATVVGLDRKLKRWLDPGRTTDGVVYVEGDQTDAALLKQLAADHGPFSLVIDDGSHVSDDQVEAIRRLVRHVEPGGFYVIEDVHTTTLEPGELPGDYGEDVWADFVSTVFDRLRKGPEAPDTPGARLAEKLSPLIDELLVARQVLAIRVRSPTGP